MLNVGVIGLGMMGNTHLDVYAKRKDVKVVAVADLIPDRLSGKVKVGGNVKGQAQGSFDINKVKKYAEGLDLINDPEIQVVDVCLPTPLHMDYAIAALKLGKHVLCEKPMSRTAKDALKLAAAAKGAKGKFMIAQCMRFWPGWTDLKEAVDSKKYGHVCAAHFRRVANHPGGEFYKDGDRCGGAVLDLHIHDTDFINFVFGTPKSVFTRGYCKETNQLDHVITSYEYPKVPIVVAEGGWAMSPGFGFSMQYTVNFEKATMQFDLAFADSPLHLIQGGKRTPVKLAPKMGYELEIAYFIDCVNKGKKPAVVTPESSAESVRIVEAEVKSAKTGKSVKL